MSVGILLVGAGGHAKAVVEALVAHGNVLVAYVDPLVAPWLDARRYDDDDAALRADDSAALAMGLGGATPEALEHRLALLERYLAAHRDAPAVVHPAAHVSPTARLEAGAIVLAGAIVQPDAVIGTGAIVNSGAIVEHDSQLGAGSHLAPGAVLLGAVTVGRCAMIGAGAVVLPEARVPNNSLVPAVTRFLPAAAHDPTAEAVE